jgi:hypothetical protein
VLAGEMRIFGSEMLVERFGFAEIKTAVTFAGGRPSGLGVLV